MNEKNNEFRFSLYQGDVLLGEKIFDADLFNPFTRYSIDIREILPVIINKFQKLLSGKKYYTKYDDNLDFYEYYKKILNSYPKDIRDNLIYNPKNVVYHIEDKVISGVECKIGLYINDKTIVERLFYVNGFNPVSRWSIELIDAIIETADLIFNHIKNVDVNNMWDDYDLINILGLSINQIRELSPSKREDFLRRIGKK